MSDKKWLVESPVRCKGKLYPVGSTLTASKADVVGLEHCLNDYKAPDEAPSDDAIAEYLEGVEAAAAALTEAIESEDNEAMTAAMHTLVDLEAAPSEEEFDAMVKADADAKAEAAKGKGKGKDNAKAK